VGPRSSFTRSTAFVSGVRGRLGFVGSRRCDLTFNLLRLCLSRGPLGHFGSWNRCRKYRRHMSEIPSGRGLLIAISRISCLRSPFAFWGVLMQEVESGFGKLPGFRHWCIPTGSNVRQDTGPGEREDSAGIASHRQEPGPSGSSEQCPPLTVSSTQRWPQPFENRPTSLEKENPDPGPQILS